MKIGEMGPFLDRALVKHKQVLIKGKAGTGKTFSFQQSAARVGFDIITLCTPLQSPVKVGGYPRPPVTEDGDATHCLFDGIARAFRATKPTVLVWEDLGMGGGETLKSILEFVQFGRIDGKVLPDFVVQGATTNDVGHGADVQGLIEPLKTRWDTIIELENSVDDIVPYGLSKGWPSDLLAFLRNAPDALHDHKPSKSMSIDGACPRGWEHVADWINDGFDDPEVIAGCVGKGRATQYLAFRSLVNELPDIDGVLMDPDGSPVPENPSAKFLVSMALASRMTAGNFGACVKYLGRLPAMFRAFSIRDAFKAEKSRRDNKQLPPDWKALASSRDFAAWSCSQDGKDVMSAAS